ncbi:unnamed protein product [Orchesella dallaii]|uniref:U6 snRNA-associated Sm-like protein LSm1 n=1 Tax=Orchesella dallaii TaxID=48710 RepID=A0ABP1S9T4_9HEXA
MASGPAGPGPARLYPAGGTNFFHGQLGGPRAHFPFHQKHEEVPSYNFHKNRNENLDPTTKLVRVEKEEEPLELNNILFGCANLLDQIDKRVQVTLRDGRNIIGTLVCIDHFSNLVMRNTIERIFVGKEYGDIPRGVFLIRGDNLVMIGEVGEEKEAEMQRILKKVSLDHILVAQKIEQDAEKAKQWKYTQALRQRGSCCSRPLEDEF